jgi:tetratricopeptide (TPR) repeat protein
LRKSSGLTVLLCCVAVSIGAIPTTAEATPTKRFEVPDDALSRALAFLGEFDQTRMFEKTYAERILREVEIIRASDRYEGDIRKAADLARVIALAGLGREKEAFAVADAMIASDTATPELYALVFELAALSDAPRAVDYLERADENLVTAAQRTSFGAGLTESFAFAVSRTLKRAKNKVARARLAEGLFKFGWPGGDNFANQNWLQMELLKGRLAKGDVAGARLLARQVASPELALELLIVKEYDPVVEASDPGARVGALLAAEEARTAAALKARPDDLKLILARAQFLRSVGREGDALVLLLPRTTDMVAVEKGGSDAFWIVNEAAFALQALGRPDEAVALMQRLIALDLGKYPDLINMAINLAEIMNRAGHHHVAATYVEGLFRDHADTANKYGLMWMWEGAACGHAMGGNLVAARPWLDRLRADPDANRAALMRGLLCANDLDGAAAQFIERLAGDDAGNMLVAAQDYTIVNLNVPTLRLLDQRLQQVVARPAVAAAIARKGRILKLPLSRTYWGMF